MELRDVLTFGPGRHTFHPGDYPWLRQMLVVAVGGQGGSSVNGSPGQPGTVQHRLYDVEDLPHHMTFVVGRGGRGRDGGRDGDPGLVVVELYGPRRRWWTRLVRAVAARL